MQDKILQIVIKAKNEAEQTLKGLTATLKQNEQGFKSMATAGTIGLGAVVGVVSLSVKAFGEAERSQRQLEHAIIQVSKGTKEQVAQVNELTSALQKKAGIDGDALNAGVAQLSTFGLQSKSVIDLTKSLADLTVNQDGVTAGADSYISSANIMAKALRGEFGMLSKMGIRFTEHQQELINTGTEQEKVATIIEGFNQNLRETTDTVDGYDKTLGQLRGTFGDILENIGASVQPAFVGLATAILPVVQMVGDWVANNPKLTVGILAVVGAVSALLVLVGGLGLALPMLIAGFGAIGVTAGAIIPTILIVSGIIASLILTMYNLYNIIILLATDWKTIWAGVKEYIKEFITYVKTEFTDMGNKLKATVEAITTAFAPFTSAVEKAYNAVKKLVEKASELGSSAGGAIKSAFSKLTGKATGGGVQVGQSYMVGEKGPEMFTPASNGSITPNYKLAGGGGVNLTINMNGGTYLDDSVAERIGDQIIQSFKRVARF